MDDVRRSPRSKSAARPSRRADAADTPVLKLADSAGYQVRMTHRLFQRAIQSRIAPHGVTLGMWYFLRVLWEQDGMTQSELSQRVGTMEPTTLSAIRDMERNGFVRRVPNARDRRKINIYLTDDGVALRGKLLPLAADVVAGALATVSPREVTMLLALLTELQNNLRQRDGEPAVRDDAALSAPLSAPSQTTPARRRPR